MKTGPIKINQPPLGYDSKGRGMESLAEAIPKEQQRVRELLIEYKRLGNPGAFGAAMLEAELARADQAVMSGDLTAMIRAYEALKDCE